MKIMKVKPFKVTDVNLYVKNILGRDPILSNIQVEGEIFNFKWHSSGHIYFSLKDDKSRIKAVMFKQNTKNLLINLEEGMKVVVEGYVSVFERDGNYQLYAQNILLKGQGELYLKYEELKKKLELKGYFDEENKKKLPYMPQKIGVITSDTGAAVRDIISVIKRRMPFAEILLYPALVQGIYAAEDLCKGIDELEKIEDIDIIIIGRGGGSIEELWAFNDEKLAKKIFEANKPIVSAVGHETDFTICDFVSDLRVPTPSVAGEMVVPDCFIENQNIISNKKRLLQSMRFKLDKEQSIIKKRELDQLVERLKLNFKLQKESVANTRKRGIENINRKLKLERQNIEKLAKLSDAYSPLRTLSRGYSIVEDSNGEAVRSVDNLIIGDELNIVFNEGRAKTKVISIENI
jgi:exodeoxyribonuclease VII large subunit